MNSDQLNLCWGNILIVDDIPDNLRVLSSALSERGYQVRCAKNGAMALLTAQKEPPHLILLDIKMPEMDGYQVCQHLKANPRTSNIPVIFLSALDEAFDKVEAFRVGGADYITKPFQLEEVLVRIQHQMQLQAAKAEIANLNAQLEQKVRARTLQLERVINKLKEEVAQHRQTKHQLLHDALHDGLTGLPNRSLFMEHLQKALERSKRNKNYLFAVLFVDLDRFKTINDSWGHDIGDRVLVAISSLLRKSARTVDTVARLSGDEFAILLEDIKNVADVRAIAERIIKLVNAPLNIEDRTIFTGSSIGIVFGNQSYQDGTELLRDADIAMYRAKDRGKGRYAVFDREMYAQTLRLSQLETDLRFALQREQFVLHYQPIVSLETGLINSFEALIRWQHPEKGLIYPGEFIGIAEETGLIVPMGEWLLEEACQQLKNWQLQFPRALEIQMGINLSSRQLKQFDLVEKLTAILSKTALESKYLRLEITESMLMDNSEQTIELLHQLKERQIQLSIDDFGTGYSSLSYLHRFPIDALKIDRSFVNLIQSDSKNSEIVSTIVTLAKSLGLKAIAEGVETPHQLHQLKALGCDEAQGYLFTKPVTSEIAASSIEKNPQWQLGIEGWSGEL